MTLPSPRLAAASIAAALTVAGATPASAGTISDDVHSFLGVPITYVLFTAGDGETNTLDIAKAAESVAVRDSTAPLVASGLCTPAEGAALCPAEFARVFFLGDGDDSLTTADAGVDVHAGAGADVVSTGEGIDTVDGGEGDDQLSAGGGNHPGLPDTADIVSYAPRTVPVVVDLTAGLGGAAGERDALSGFEGAVGGRGNDRLTGRAAAASLSGRRGDDLLIGLGDRDVLWGGAGDDTLRGGAARDELDGGPGSDRLEGGSGNDSIRANAGRNDADVIDCGPGRDVVRIDARVDRTRNCERVIRN